MANSFKVGSFTRRTTLGTQAITGIGFQPKGIILWGVKVTAGDTFSDSGQGGLQVCYGMGDGTSSVALTTNSADNVATSDQNRHYRLDAIYVSTVLQPFAGAAAARASLASLDADGFTLSWDFVSGDTNADLVHYLALGGSDLDVHVGRFEVLTGATGNQVVSGLSFSPVSVLFFPLWDDVLSNDNDDLSGIPSVGWTDGSNQVAVTVESDDAVNPSNTFRYQNTAKCYALQTTPGGAIDTEAQITSLNSDGFTVNVTNAPFTDEVVFYMAIGSSVGTLLAASGTLTQPAATGSQSVAGLSFTPKAVLLQSVGRASSGSVEAQSRWSFGAASSASDQRGVWIGDEDAVSPTVNARYHATARLLTLASPAATASSSTTEGAAALTSLDVSGFTLNWTTTDGTGREVAYLALGDGTPPQATVRETQEVFEVLKALAPSPLRETQICIEIIRMPYGVPPIIVPPTSCPAVEPETATGPNCPAPYFP